MLILLVVALSNPTKARTEPIVIVALGDSLVQGYGLVPENGFVPQLQRWLKNQDLDVVVINAGVSGDTTSGGRARIDWTLAGKVDGLILSLGGNDALRGTDPTLVRDNIDQMLRTAAIRQLPTLLVGIAVPGNFGHFYREEFSSIYPQLAEQHQTLLYPNFLKSLTDEENLESNLAEFFQNDAIHPNARGVKRIVEDMGPIVRDLIVRISVQH